MLSSASPVLIVGCGYVGQAVAHIELQSNEAIYGLVSSQASCATLQKQQIIPLQLDLDQANSFRQIPANSRLYYFVPPPSKHTKDTRITALLEYLVKHPPAKVVLLSTTGVYGDCQGAWVDEETPVAPKADRAQRRWHAEQQLQHWHQMTDVPITILRVAGIYGPNKLPITRLQKGLPLLHPNDAPWSNRIHIDDLVQTCIAAMNTTFKNEVYNVSDGAPSTMTDYFLQVADLLNIPHPPMIQRQQISQLSAGMQSYLNESRRISNRKMCQQLKIQLRYPDLSSGLATCWPS